MAEIIFTGNVGRDAEIKFPKNGGPAFATFSACDSKSKKNQAGEWETLAEQWFNVTVFGPAAESLGAAIRKGDRVKVAGEMYERKYENKEGQPGTSLDVVAVGVSVFPKRNGGQQSPSWSGQGGAPQQAPQQGNGWGQPQQAPAPQQGQQQVQQGQQPPADPWSGTQQAAPADWGQPSSPAGNTAPPF